MATVYSKTVDGFDAVKSEFELLYGVVKGIIFNPEFAGEAPGWREPVAMEFFFNEFPFWPTETQRGHPHETEAWFYELAFVLDGPWQWICNYEIPEPKQGIPEKQLYARKTYFGRSGDDFINAQLSADIVRWKPKNPAAEMRLVLRGREPYKFRSCWDREVFNDIVEKHQEENLPFPMRKYGRSIDDALLLKGYAKTVACPDPKRMI